MYNIYIHIYVKYFAYGRVFFFILWGLKYTAFRFDKFGSYIKMLKRSSRSVRRQRLTVTGRWLSGARGHGQGGWKTPVIYIHFGMRFTIIIYCVHRRRRERTGNSICRNVFSLPTKALPSKRFSFLYLFIFYKLIICEMTIFSDARFRSEKGKTVVKTCFFTRCYTIVTRIMNAERRSKPSI